MSHPGVYGTDIGVHQRGDRRWQVSRNSHAIDRRGEKDTFTDDLSDHATQAEALAAANDIEAELANQALTGQP